MARIVLAPEVREDFDRIFDFRHGQVIISNILNQSSTAPGCLDADACGCFVEGAIGHRHVIDPSIRSGAN